MAVRHGFDEKRGIYILNQQNLAGFIWSVADILKGEFNRSDFGRIVLPFILECILEPIREQVLALHGKFKDSEMNLDVLLTKVSGHNFNNDSLTRTAILERLKPEPILKITFSSTAPLLEKFWFFLDSYLTVCNFLLKLNTVRFLTVENKI